MWPWYLLWLIQGVGLVSLRGLHGGMCLWYLLWFVQGEGGVSGSFLWEVTWWCVPMVLTLVNPGDLVRFFERCTWWYVAMVLTLVYPGGRVRFFERCTWWYVSMILTLVYPGGQARFFLSQQDVSPRHLFPVNKAQPPLCPVVITK